MNNTINIAFLIILKYDNIFNKSVFSVGICILVFLLKLSLGKKVMTHTLIAK